MSIAADLLIRVKSETSGAVSGLSALSAGLVGLGVGAAAASVAFVNMGMQAQDSLAVLQGYTGTSATQIKSYTTSLETLGVKTGETLTALADGLYPIVSRGYQGADALKVLTLAAMDASASGSRVVDVAGALSSVMSAYGAKASEAGHYSDVMNAAITYGAQKFSDFAGAVGNTVSVASNLHIPFEQIAAAEATLTQHGMSANMAFTDMNFLIQKLYQPVGVLSDAVTKAGGHFDATKYSSLDLMGKLSYLQSQTGLNSAAFLKLIGGMRSAKDAMGLLTDNGKTYSAVLDKMTGTGGRTAAAFAVHTKTMQFGFAQVGSAISTAAFQLVQFLSPLVVPWLTKLANAIAGAGGDLKTLGTWLSNNKVAFDTLKGSAVALGAALLAIKTTQLIAGMATLVAGLPAAIAGFAGLDFELLAAATAADFALPALWGTVAAILGIDVALGPVILIVAALALAVAGVILVITHWAQITGFLGTVWKDTQKVLATVWNDIQGTATTVWGAISSFFLGIWNGIEAFIGPKIKAIVGVLTAVWDGFKAYFTPLWNTISGIVRVAFEIIGALLSKFGTWAHDQWDKIWNPIAQKATDIWNGISKFVGDKMSAIGTFFHNTWDTVQKDLSKAWEVISKFVGDKLSALGTNVQKLVKPIREALMGPFNWLKDHVGDILKDAANFGIDRLNDLQNALKTFLNTVARGLNIIAADLGVKDRVPLWEPSKIPHLASGARNFAGGMALVGEEGPEIVQLPRGATVIPARLSQMLMGLAGSGGLPGFAGGVGDIAGSIAGWFGGGASSLLHNVLNTLGVGSLTLPQPLTADAGAIFNRVFNEAITKLQQWMATFTSAQNANMPTGTMAHPNIGGNVVQWLLQAIADTGVPQSWLTGLEIIAQHESGGNPNAINLTDINARHGDPSRGLMQTIMSTFLANALPGHGDIWNPVDNAIAAIRYIERRYGSIQSVPGVRSVEAGHPYVGYANGGWINEPIAGIGRSGTRYQFGEVGAEYVSPSRAAPAEVKPPPRQTIIHVHGDMTENAVYRVAREQDWQERLHGGG